MIYFYYENSQGEMVSSNLKPELLFDLNLSSDFNERVNCPIENKVKRHYFENNIYGKFYLAIYDKNLTSRNFLKYIELTKTIIPSVKSLKEDNKKVQDQKIRRLKHNLINYNATIIQEIYKLIPQEDLVKEGKGQVKAIKKIIDKNSHDASYTLLRILKNASLMKAEFEVYDMLNKENPYLDFQKHRIHKIILLTLNSFWLDLIEKNIIIDVANCMTEVNIDYKTISVALCHFFDNATKYTLPNSSFNIYFNSDEFFVYVYFEMTSLEIETNDLEKIFNENYSGKWSKVLGLDGDGIGMTVINKVIELNEGQFIINPSKFPELDQTVNSIPYCRNQFVLRFNKSI